MRTYYRKLLPALRFLKAHFVPPPTAFEDFLKCNQYSTLADVD